MTYELAKQLKDAGFPQKVKYGELYYHPEQGFLPVSLEMQGKVLSDGCLRFPSLSVLIDSCGERWSTLERNWDKTSFVATASPSTGYNYFGSTPEEAVATLYLALKTKNPE